VNVSEEIKRMSVEASKLKSVILRNNNIDILLYLAKYNPTTTIKEIKERFGEESLKEIDLLKQSHLVREEKERLILTDEGIFQVEGLLTLVV